MGVFDILGVVFVVLKLTGVIAWPWLYVLAPFTITAVLLLITTAFLAFAGIAYIAELRRKRDIRRMFGRG